MEKTELAELKGWAKRYGLLLIKKLGRHDKFALFSLRRGRLQEGDGFSLGREDVVDLLRYYRLKYPRVTTPTLLELRNRTETRRRGGLARIEALEKVVERLNRNENIRGTYTAEMINGDYSDGYCDKPQRNKADRHLQKHATQLGLLLVRHPYRYIMDPEIENRYALFDKSTGKIIKGDGYSCTIAEVRAFFSELESAIFEQ